MENKLFFAVFFIIAAVFITGCIDEEFKGIKEIKDVNLNGITEKITGKDKGSVNINFNQHLYLESDAGINENKPVNVSLINSANERDYYFEREVFVIPVDIENNRNLTLYDTRIYIAENSSVIDFIYICKSDGFPLKKLQDKGLYKFQPELWSGQNNRIYIIGKIDELPGDSGLVEGIINFKMELWDENGAINETTVYHKIKVKRDPEG